MGTASNSHRGSGGAGSTPRGPKARQSGAGRADGGNPADGWTAAAALPPIQRRPRAVAAEVQAVIDACLADNAPRAKELDDARAAQSLLKRIRYAAAQQGAQVRARIAPHGKGVLLTVTVTKEGS